MFQNLTKAAGNPNGNPNGNLHGKSSVSNPININKTPSPGRNKSDVNATESDLDHTTSDIRNCENSESKEMYSAAPHSWLCNGNLLQLHNPEIPENKKIFQVFPLKYLSYLIF